MGFVAWVVLLIVFGFVVFCCAIPLMLAKEARSAAKAGDGSRVIACVIVAALLLWIVIKSL